MNLISNCKDVLQKAWSVRFAALSALFAGLQHTAEALPIAFFGINSDLMPAVGGVLGAIGGVFAALVVVARVVDQGLAAK